MVISCAITRFEPEGYIEDVDNPFSESSELFVPIDFALPSTAGYMTCAKSKIVVDSVRWPVYRLSIPDQFVNMRSPLDQFVNEDGIDSPSEIDAMIYVMPACETTGTPEPVCRSDFTETACFPFCAAARLTGSRNNGMLLYSASDWTEHVELVNQDCSTNFAANSTDITYTMDDSLDKVYGETISYGYDLLAGKTTISAWDPSQQKCVFNDAISSRMLKTKDVAAELGDYGVILLPEQPFALAGDVVLTSTIIDGLYYVKVQRMYGLQGTGMFSLVMVNNQLPANAPCFTQANCDAQVGNPDYFVIPYNWYESPLNHNPAVASKWGVFFAVNPSLRMFSEYFKKCKNETSLLQFQTTSSYGPIRIWRVDAFAYHDPLYAQASSTGTSVEVEDAFSGFTDMFNCAQKFNVMVTSMEYLNDANIVVQILYTKPSY
jgi:hypothetical protein